MGIFWSKIYRGFPIQIFKIHFIGIFLALFFPLFSGPRAWVGLLGGPAAAARVRAAMHGAGKHLEQQRPIRPSVFSTSTAAVLKYTR
jgi:hypothetical protein